MKKETCSVCGASPAIQVGESDSYYFLCGSCVSEQGETLTDYRTRYVRLTEIVRLLTELIPEY